MTPDVIVLIIFAVLLYFVFPIYVGVVNYRQGKKALGITVLVSIFFFIGWLVALVVLFSSRPNLPSAACPKCESSRTSVQEIIFDANTGTPLMKPGFIYLAGGTLLIFALIMTVAGISSLLAPPSNSGVTVVWTVFGTRVADEIVYLFFVIVGLVILGNLYLRGSVYIKTPKSRFMKYTCKSCKHEWQEPIPQPTRVVAGGKPM